MIFDYEGIELLEMKNYGFFQLSVNDSAYLIACSVYNNSEAGKAHWKKGQVMPKYLFVKNPELRAERKTESRNYHKTIIKAIENKELPASHIVKDFQDKIVQHKTLIDALDLYKWLKKRTPDYSDAVDEYYGKEWSLVINFLDTMPAVRLQNINTAMFNDVVKFSEIWNEILRTKGIIDASDFSSRTFRENRVLKEKLDDTEKLLSDAENTLKQAQDKLAQAQADLKIQGETLNKAQARITRLNEATDNRERTSLHKLFMGMAMSKKSFDKQQLLSGDVTAKDIENILTSNGLDLTDKTIKKYLGEARNTLQETLQKQSSLKE